MADTSLLDRIFAAKEEDVETFADIIGKDVPSFTLDEVLELKKTSDYKTERQKFLEITHGTHENDYVWHIKPYHNQKPWAVSMDRIIYAIAVIVVEFLPDEIPVKTFLPDPLWEIEEITVKAQDAVIHWSLISDDFQKMTGQLFEVLNTLI
jgi:hypothetical protein